jgi:hypothetical protein
LLRRGVHRAADEGQDKNLTANEHLVRVPDTTIAQMGIAAQVLLRLGFLFALESLTYGASAGKPVPR